jgi:hypothetical protein
MNPQTCGQNLTVWKFDLPLTSTPSEVLPLRLPAGARILKVGEQGADPILGPRFFVWALVDPDEKLQELRYVVTAGTGHKMEITTLADKTWDHVETVMALGGRLVVHVWISRPEGKGGIEVAADNP